MKISHSFCFSNQIPDFILFLTVIYVIYQKFNVEQIAKPIELRDSL